MQTFFSWAAKVIIKTIQNAIVLHLVNFYVFEVWVSVGFFDRFKLRGDIEFIVYETSYTITVRCLHLPI